MKRDGSDPQAGHEGNVPAAQLPVVGSRRRVHRRAQALHRRNAPSAPARCGCITAPAARAFSSPKQPERSEGRGRAGVLAGRPLPLLQPGRHAGPVFDYNKDPNAEIYAIQRLDRETGEDRAVRRRPGRHRSGRRPRRTARRSRSSAASASSTVLYVARSRLGRGDADLRRARSRHAGDLGDPRRLPRDRVDARQPARSSSGRAEDPARRMSPRKRGRPTIPVPRAGHAAASTEAVRFPVEVAPDVRRCDAALGRSRRPTGKQVVYQALGHIWITRPAGRRAAAADRRAITSSSIPSFSRDGQLDRLHDLGRREARQRSAWSRRDGGEGRVVTHRARPLRRAGVLARRRDDRLSRGGRRLPARRLWSRDAASSSFRPRAASRLRDRRRASLPHFGARERPRLLHDVRGRDKQSLRSSSTSTASDERTHVDERSTRPSSRVSPDEKWVAFTRELQRVDHAVRRRPASRRRRAEDEGAPGRAGVARRRRVPPLVGRRRSLYWSLGPELFTRDLKEAFAFLDGAPGEAARAAGDGRRHRLRGEADVPSGKLALVGRRASSPCAATR